MKMDKTKYTCHDNIVEEPSFHWDRTLTGMQGEITAHSMPRKRLHTDNC